MINKTKKCSKCKRIKDVDEFYKNKNIKDGLCYQCKACMKKMHNNWEEKNSGYQHEWYKNNKGKKIKQQKRWVLKNKNKVAQYNKEYGTKRYKTDFIFRLAHILRRRIRIAIKRSSKLTNTVELLGCTIKELKKHLELNFINGMTWENQGKWHIDHIKPCSFFDLSKPEEQQKCFHYSNLQPLWAIDNLKKSNKLNYCVGVNL